jgi:hypothetical protein
MKIFEEIYNFAASAGALEGYVYHRDQVDIQALDDWINNLVKQYFDLPIEVRESFQPSLDRTLGRAVHSIVSLLGADHHYTQALKKLIIGGIPKSFDDFEKEKEVKIEKH